MSTLKAPYAAPPRLRLTLQGLKEALPKSDPLAEDDYFKVAALYEVGATTRGTMVSHTEEWTDEVIGLTTQSGVEWYGLAQDMPDVLATAPLSTRGGETEFVLPQTIGSVNPTRGFAGELLTKIYKIVSGNVRKELSPRELAKKEKLWSLANIKTIASLAGEGVALPTGRKIDEMLCPAPGLYIVTETGARGGLATGVPSDEKILIFLHGTFSSFTGGFAGMPKEAWSDIHAAYPGGVYALDHRTITVSPVQNALDLLAALPGKADIDLITHSRGGLVGDVLARCDARLSGPAYSAGEIDTIRREANEVEKDWERAARELGDMGSVPEDVARGLREEARRVIATRNAHTDLAGEMENLVGITSRRTITVNRIVRVACPAAGTTLLSERMDHFLNAVLNVGKLVSGGALASILGLVRRLLIAVIDERRDPAVFPGIYAMVPGRAFSRINNAASITLPSELINVAGNTKVGGGPLKSLATFLSNLYYWQANDFVVDTASMSRGLHLRQRNTTLTFTNTRIAHSSYFKDRVHRRYILRLLLNGELGDLSQTDEIRYLVTLRDQTDEGKLANKLYDPGKLAPAVVEGNKPIVVLLPGIMGSNLSVDDREQWFQLTALAGGALVNKLGPKTEGQAEVVAQTVMKDYYGKLASYLVKQEYDVLVFPYDWRVSLSISAELLRIKLAELRQHGQPISFIAHSMGGLVVREYLFRHRTDWLLTRDDHDARIIYLGTPWRGSHLITEVLTGYSKRVKQLAKIDLTHTKRELLTSLNQLDGIYELLPLDDPNLRDEDWWAEQQSLARRRDMPAIPKASLVKFEAFRKFVEAKLTSITPADYDRMHYIAGHAPGTVDGYKKVFRAYLLRNVLKFTKTPKGDGSVTWKKGIPAEIDADRVYYSRTPHGDLANDPELFGAIRDLLVLGATKDSALSPAPPVRATRGGALDRIASSFEAAVPLITPMDAIMGAGERGLEAGSTTMELRVEVLNGDLKWAKFPVMVGHFEHDGIVSAEKAIDYYLGNILSERHQLGFYPGKIGEQEVIHNTDSNPKGTVIVGLGNKDELTSSNLARTVEKGIMKYVIFLRDNGVSNKVIATGGHGISVLFVGSNYGQMPLRESIRSILIGIRDANRVIEVFNTTRSGMTLYPITTVEFVDYYEDRAYEAYKSLEAIGGRQSVPGISMDLSIKPGFGRRKRFLRDESRSWWQTFTTTVDKNGPNKAEQMVFRTSNRGAAFNQNYVNSNLELARQLAGHFTREPLYNKKYAKVLFELLIPTSYKDFIRNRRNMIWRLDRTAAAFPWEMFYDSSTGREPSFVRAGMVRQLLDVDAPLRPTLVRTRKCLVIAKADFGEELPSLPGAKVEGEMVARKLGEAEYAVTQSINDTGVNAVVNLFLEPFKIIHFASHGYFEPEGERNGIALGEGVFLKTGDLAQLSTTPELVFVNCCFVGEIDPAWEAYRRGRHRLAANIGTQLIRNGVKAVIVSGWAVDDAAAATFAGVFYDEMLAGGYFGESVRKAREACYLSHPHTNTWGAYQCYGDPFYRTDIGASDGANDEDISLVQEVILHLDNLISRAITIKGEHRMEADALRSEVSLLIRRANELGVTNSAILEREAELYLYLADYTAAKDRYRILFAMDTGLHKIISYLNYHAIDARDAFAKAYKTGSRSHGHLHQIADKILDHNLEQSPTLAVTTLADVYKRAAAVGTVKQSTKSASLAAMYYLQAANSLDIESALLHESGLTALESD